MKKKRRNGNEKEKKIPKKKRGENKEEIKKSEEKRNINEKNWEKVENREKRKKEKQTNKRGHVPPEDSNSSWEELFFVSCLS